VVINPRCIYEVFELQKIRAKDKAKKGKEIKSATAELEKAYGAAEKSDDQGAVADAKLAVLQLQSDQCSEVQLAFVLPEEEEDKLRLQLEKPNDEGFKQVVDFLFEINVSEAECGQQKDEMMIDELILASTLHNALRREQQAADTTERKNLLEKYTKDLKALHEELVQAIASGNVTATKAAQTAVDNTQQQAAECVGLDRERWATQLHDIGTEEVNKVVRQRMLKWVAQVATIGKKVQVESLIRKHTADWYDRKGNCRCGRESSVCCCKLAKRWQDDIFEDLTFGDVKDDPAPTIRRTVAAFKVAKSVAVAAQRAVAKKRLQQQKQETGYKNDHENSSISIVLSPANQL